MLQVNSKFLGGEGAQALPRLDSPAGRRRIRPTISSCARSSPPPARTRTTPPRATGRSCASRRRRWKTPRTSSSPRASTATSATTIPSSAGRRTSTTTSAPTSRRCSSPPIPRAARRSSPAPRWKRRGPLYEIVKDAPTGEMIHLRTNKVAAPTFPFETKIETPLSDKAPRREQLAAWITSPDNRFFASSYVNRLWGYLTGVGVIEPLDDIRAGNPPTNPELLDYLKTEFINHGFDVRHIMRLICQSRTYQLSVSHEQVERGRQDQLLARHRAPPAGGSALRFRAQGDRRADPPARRHGRRSSFPIPRSICRAASSRISAGPARESACECERSSDLRLGSVMALLSGPAVADAIGDPKNGLAKLVAAQTDDAKLADEIFARVLNRPATETEIKKTLESVGRRSTPSTPRSSPNGEAKEKEQAPIIAQDGSRSRSRRSTTAKKELARYETEIAPKVAAAEKKRLADIAAAEAAVKDYEKTKLAAAQAKFEETVPVARTYTGWQLLDPADLQRHQRHHAHQAGRWLDQGRRRSVRRTPITRVDGGHEDRRTSPASCSKCCPSADEPGFGPGRAGGNFVLGEFAVKTGDYRRQPGERSRVRRRHRGFQPGEVRRQAGHRRQEGRRQQRLGHRADKSGVPHYAAFTFKKPLGDEKGSRLRFEMNQPRAGHVHHRALPPLGHHLDAAAQHRPAARRGRGARRSPPPLRTKEEQAAIAAYWKEADPELPQAHARRSARTSCRCPSIPACSSAATCSPRPRSRSSSIRSSCNSARTPSKATPRSPTSASPPRRTSPGRWSIAPLSSSITNPTQPTQTYAPHPRTTRSRPLRHSPRHHPPRSPPRRRLGHSRLHPRLAAQPARQGRRGRSRRQGRPRLGQGQERRHGLSPGRPEPSRSLGSEGKRAGQNPQPLHEHQDEDPGHQFHRDPAEARAGERQVHDDPLDELHAERALQSHRGDLPDHDRLHDGQGLALRPARAAEPEGLPEFRLEHHPPQAADRADAALRGAAAPVAGIERRRQGRHRRLPRQGLRSLHALPRWRRPRHDEDEPHQGR